MVANAIVTDKYFDLIEIKNHLKNVEYIIMAAPAPEQFKETPIQFTIFLNTSDELPRDVQEAVFEKFLKENGIRNPDKIMSQLMPVGFSMSQQDTAMPLLLVKKEDQTSIPNIPMHVYDFLADSDNFFEAKQEKLTGWTYSYNEE
ncbi:MAG: hypothetical protein DRG78_14695 [Epsilonproteobacteria bacterium]|nr:MAG: hypothetical protein DRG78_14695 [Campylobacterota bacterium]